VGRPTRRELVRLARRHRLALLVLFGSRARGNAGPASDLDLAFLGADSRRPPRRLSLWAECTSAFGTEAIDLLDLRGADPLAAYEALRAGRPLYEREPGSFAARAPYAARLFADTRKFREAEDTYLDAFLRRERERRRLAARRVSSPG